MGSAATTSLTDALDLEGAALLVPSLQSEPYPIRRIKPGPCTQACPAGVNVKAYTSLIAERRFADALEVIRRRCPLPGICGRVCSHPCEMACHRGTIDEPVAVRSLKRFVADLEREHPLPTPPPGPERPERIAVIGSGPAGLTAAYDLRLAGYPVTVFESEQEAGGMLRYGITAYRLPRDILAAEIDVLVRTGVEIRTGCRIGTGSEMTSLLEDGYHAVLVAVGAQLGRRLNVPGENECAEVEDALAFLRRVNDGNRSPIGRAVVVLGGGSTAVEAARTALRVGAESVEIIYRRYREELLAGDEEIEAAESEGIRFRFLVAPLRVVMDAGRLKGLECVKVGLGEPDGTGRRRPIPIPGTEFPVPADYVLAAVGQEADLGFLPEDTRDRLIDRGRVQVDTATLMTSVPGVFGAGDVVTGPATLIDAIAAGHKAAESIRHYIEEGVPGIREQRPELRAPVEYELPDTPPIETPRRRPATAGPQPGHEFAEVEQPFTVEEAVAEARRCLRCGACGECHICAPTCQRRHIMVRLPSEGDFPGGPTALVRVPGNVAMSLDAARTTPGWLLPHVEPGTLPEIDTTAGMAVELRPLRARIHDDWCRACGSCVAVCPFDAAQLVDTDSLDAKARIESALCRGCNLCSAVCPTNSAASAALSPEWWGSRVEDVFAATAAGTRGVAPFVVLACQRRAGALEATLHKKDIHVEVIRFRCVGQIVAGMLLELYRHGARGVLVAGCQSGRCRFGTGATLAQEQVNRAYSLLDLLGGDRKRLACDWSGGRAFDLLDAPLERLIMDVQVAGDQGTSSERCERG